MRFSSFALSLRSLRLSGVAFGEDWPPPAPPAPPAP